MRSEWSRAGWIVVALAPPLALVAFQYAYAIRLPYMDAWELVPYLEKAKVGALGLADLFDQHNAHRIAIPRTAMILLAVATGWDHRVEIAAITLCAWAAFAVWWRILARDTESPRLPRIALVSMGTFSLAAWRNWTWGWQIQILLCLVFALLCIASLSSDRLGRLRHPLALAAALAATFSFASGLAIWPAAGIVLTLRRTRLQMALLWLGICGLTAIVYTIGFHVPPDTANIQGLRLIAYVLAYLGGGLLGWSPRGAVYIGLLGLALIVFLVAKMDREQRCNNAPLIALVSCPRNNLYYFSCS